MGLKIRICKLLWSSLVLIFFLPMAAPASVQSLPPPLNTDTIRKNDPGFDTLIGRLGVLNDPVSREGSGIMIIQAPGERYRFQFRLIARGPEALRMEIFDPFGRSMLYLVSYQGETRLFSIPQKKEIPFNLPSSGPWSALPQIPFLEMLKIFWGRAPLFPFHAHQTETILEKENKSIKLSLLGSVQQELWITPNPFSLTRSRLTNPSDRGQIEIVFSDFSDLTGNHTPMRCEIKDGTGEHVLTIRYETLVPRPDISDEVFKLPEFSDVQPSAKEKKP